MGVRVAQYRLSVKVIGRSSGRSSTAAAAYRAGMRIEDERTGMIHDYTRKEGVLHTEILAPENAPTWMRDRAQLWNAVEAVERRKDAQLSREMQLSLPHELTRDQQVNLVRRFVQEQHVSQGMIADIAVHGPSPHEMADERNVHAHIMLTMRELTAEGFGKKAREWNDTNIVDNWREQWANYQNREFKQLGLPCRVDHRSLEDQGEMREPQRHLGPIASEIERDGRASHRGDENRAILRRNGLRSDLERVDNLIDAKIAFEKRKFNVWADKKRGQIDMDSKHSLAQYQVGLGVRMQALEDAIDAEFGDTKQHLTAKHDDVASNLAIDGWRKFIRDITLTTHREKRELERLEREQEQIRQAEALKREQLLQQEQNRKVAIMAQERIKSESLEKGIQKARDRRESDDWASRLSSQKKPPHAPEKRLQTRFNEVSSTDKQKDSKRGESDTDGQQDQTQKQIKGLQRDRVDRIAEQLKRRREKSKDRGRER